MQRKNRLKPRELKPSVKQYLFTEAIRQRKVPRELLANRLIRELEESHEIPPTLETAKRYISKARNAHNPIDQPWTLGACKEYSSFSPRSLCLFSQSAYNSTMKTLPHSLSKNVTSIY